MEFVNKFLVTMLGVVLFASCSKDNSEPDNINIAGSVLLRITKNGEVGNFLNTLNTNNIQLYYKKDNNLTLLQYGGDNPSGYSIMQEPPINEKIIGIACYIGGNNSHEETYIKWSPTDIDTLSYDITRYQNGSIVINANTLKFNNVTITANNQYGLYDVVKN